MDKEKNVGVIGEISSVNALISAIKPEQIPVARDVDIEQIKSLDEDPLEVVVEIPAGPSKRGWNYTVKSLQDIVDYTNENTLNGFLGHQRPEDISNEFKMPVTHWVGAQMINDRAYFRGVVDADAKNLKRWLRTGRIKEVSIFGFPRTIINEHTGETDVVGYEPLSIDWTPLHRPGMPTKIVGMEMNNPIEDKGGNENMTFEEMMAKLNNQIKNGDVTYGQVMGEMKVTPELLAGEMEEVKEAFEAKETLSKIEKALEATGEMDIVEEVKKGKEAIKAVEKQNVDSMVNELLEEKKVTGEMAQGLIKKMLDLDSVKDKETLSGEIDGLLEDKFIKAALSNSQVDQSTGLNTFGGNKESSNSVVRTVRRSI